MLVSNTSFSIWMTVKVILFTRKVYLITWLAVHFCGSFYHILTLANLVAAKKSGTDYSNWNRPEKLDPNSKIYLIGLKFLYQKTEFKFDPNPKIRVFTRKFGYRFQKRPENLYSNPIGPESKPNRYFRITLLGPKLLYPKKPVPDRILSEPDSNAHLALSCIVTIDNTLILPIFL